MHQNECEDIRLCSASCIQIKLDVCYDNRDLRIPEQFQHHLLVTRYKKMHIFAHNL